MIYVIYIHIFGIFREEKSYFAVCTMVLKKSDSVTNN